MAHLHDESQRMQGRTWIGWVYDEVEVLDDWRTTTWHSEPIVRKSLRSNVFFSLNNQNGAFRNGFHKLQLEKRLKTQNKWNSVIFDVLDKTHCYDSLLTLKHLAAPLLSSIYRMLLQVFSQLGVPVIIINTPISVRNQMCEAVTDGDWPNLKFCAKRNLSSILRQTETKASIVNLSLDALEPNKWNHQLV